MLLYKDFEVLFSNPVIMEQFNKAKSLYHSKFDNEAANIQYKQARKELKCMVDMAK